MSIIVENGIIYVDGVNIANAPALRRDSKVHVWRVPTEYRASGYFASQNEQPACRSKDATYIGFVEVEADPILVLEERKRQAMQDLFTQCDADLELLGQQYPKRESDTWPFQLEEAKDILAGTAEITPFIDNTIYGTEFTRTGYAQLIVDNNAAWAATAGSIVNKRLKAKKAIQDATTLEELEAVTW